MGLVKKGSKTRISHHLPPSNGQGGFDVLGFTIRQFPVGKSQSGKNGHSKPLGFKTLIKPSQAKGKEHLRAVEKIAHSLKAASEKQMNGALNQQVVSWSNYYRSEVAQATFRCYCKV